MHAEADIWRSWEGRRAALVVAHPGHELRVHHWLECARPVVLVLTDGSGHTDHSRLQRTTALVEKAGAKCGEFYGRLTDQQLYRAVLAGEVDLFARLVEEIARALASENVEYVAGDAVEGVNPGHDLCRLLLNAAVMRIETTSRRRLDNFEFPVEGPPDAWPIEDEADAIVLKLADDAYRRKLEAAQLYSELNIDMTRIMAAHDLAAFRIECLYPVRYGFDIGSRFEHPAIYEGYGEKQVAAGLYREVIRFREHLVPIAQHLGEHYGWETVARASVAPRSESR